MAMWTLQTPDGMKMEYTYCRGITMSAKMKRMAPHGGDMEKHFNEIKHMEIRDDDLYLATYPKCGTHWAWEFMSMLRRGSAEHEKCTKETVFLDFQPVASIDARPSPRILNSHLPASLTPQEILEKKVKIVHVMRNPKDAFVSMYHHFKAMHKDEDYVNDFKTYLPFALGSYGLSIPSSFYDYMKGWEQFTDKHPDQILNLFYEDIKEDPVREITKLDKFLGTNRDAKLIEQIAEACNFQNMKKADSEVKVKEGLLKKMPSFMYRKGEVGDWKNHFTVSMNEQMDKWIEDNSYGSKIKFRYTI